MNRELAVHVDLDGQPVLCGRLWTRSAPREGASFEYDPTWRTSQHAFALDPVFFLHDGVGWRLAPAYDLNPMPTDVRPRVHALAIDDTDPTASMDTVWAVAPKFGLGTKEARQIAREVATVVRTWRSAGKRCGLKPKELDRMESAFEHADLARAAR